jgi:hypothetical protein
MDDRTLRQELQAMERRLMQHVANQIRQTQITNPSTDGEEDGAAGLPNSGGSYQRTPRRWQHFGFRSVPPNDAGAVMLLVGGGSASEITLAEDSTGYGPALAKGEVAIFSTASGAYLKIDKNGAVSVMSSTGQLFTANGSTDFEVRGTTYRAAEATFNAALQTVLTAQATGWTALATAFTALSLYVPFGATPQGAMSTASTACTAAATACTTAATAAATMEAGAANYLSTKNKIG